MTLSINSIVTGKGTYEYDSDLPAIRFLMNSLLGSSINPVKPFVRMRSSNNASDASSCFHVVPGLSNKQDKDQVNVIGRTLYIR